MGIGFVLIVWAILGTILTIVGTIALGGITAFLTRGVKAGRRKIILVASIFPLACFVWAGCVFVFQAAINIGLLHRDAGIGDGWDCPLPNGYAISMIDVTDEGVVYNPKTQKFADGISSQDDAIFDVRILQVTPRFIFGGFDSKATEHYGNGNGQVDRYFILNVQTGKHTEIPTIEALRDAVAPLGIQLNLEPIETVYFHYYFNWFEILAAILLFAPPLIAAGLIVRWIIRLRKTRETPAATPQ